MQLAVFAVLAVVTLGAAMMVVTTRNLLRSALWLILAFVGIAGIFILLEAEFMAVAQILVYVGAISTLIIFAVMLTRNVMNPQLPRFNSQWGVVGGLAVLLWVILSFVVTRVPWPVTSEAVPANAIELLGTSFVVPFVVPFEIASILLVVAMVGAIIIARERE